MAGGEKAISSSKQARSSQEAREKRGQKDRKSIEPQQIKSVIMLPLPLPPRPASRLGECWGRDVCSSVGFSLTPSFSEGKILWAAYGLWAMGFYSINSFGCGRTNNNDFQPKGGEHVMLY